MPDTDLDVVGKSLRQSFAGASVYPGLTDDFFNVTRQHVLKGDRREALKTSQLAIELYPDSQVANFIQGIALVLNSDANEGAAALKKAAAINTAPNALASPVSLNTISCQIAGVGRLDDRWRFSTWRLNSLRRGREPLR